MAVRKRKAGKAHVNSKKHLVDGLEFPSRFQADRWLELRDKEERGEIFDLQHEVVFELKRGDIEVKQLRADKLRVYTADATYRELCKPDVLVVEESKGRMMKDASLRCSVFKALYPEHDFRIVYQKKRRKKRKK